MKAFGDRWEWGWTTATVVCGFAATCFTGFCDFSETSLSSSGAPVKTEAETRANREVLYFEKSPQESGEGDWDERNERYNTKEAL